MTTFDPFYALHSQHSTLVIDCRANAPTVLYWGARLGDTTTPQMLTLMGTRQEAQARIHSEPALSLSPETGAGFMGSPGIAIHRDGKQWGVFASIEAVRRYDEHTLRIRSRCDATELEIMHTLRLDHDSDVLRAATAITNLGTTRLNVERCDAPCIPLPLHYDQILGFEGRWANEFQLQAVPRFLGRYQRENRTGRTSHDTFPGVIVHTQATNQTVGNAFAFHLGWSGNHRVSIEEFSDGRACAQLGELFYPGELILEAGATYRSPSLYGAHSDQGLSHLSRCFHRYVRSHLTDERMAGKLKPVHFNTWEAMYFDLSENRLCELADAAAKVGVERFVLDDGWFGQRKGETAGLGDWYVARDVFPDGLHPLIKHVHDLGMEFGLWLEPEMVNPDSELYRAHPDWVLHTDPAPRLPSRHQLVLNLTHPPVSDYLFERIDALLDEYPIAYIKWDMNRDLNQPGGHDGHAATHRQTLALYKLLGRIRAAHPLVEIESCSSGGGRADFGILEHTDRVWTSDSNDALDRLRIQQGFSYFFPPEFMGAHVGPRNCHITGRVISMATRSAVAMFGDMGIEANLLDMSDEDLVELTAAVALHKQHRELIFSGDVVRLDLATYENGYGIVAPDRTEALFSYALLESVGHSVPARYRFDGLDAQRMYQLEIVWPPAPKSYSPSILNVINGATLSGEALMGVGIQLPVMHPASALVFHLQTTTPH